MKTHQSTKRQIQAKESPFAKYFYVETETSMYEGTTLKEALEVWVGHKQTDQSDVCRVGSLG